VLQCDKLPVHLDITVETSVYNHIHVVPYYLRPVITVCSELNGQLIERVATEFNRLQFYVTKVRGMPLVDELKPVRNLQLFLSLIALISQ